MPEAWRVAMAASREPSGGQAAVEGPESLTSQRTRRVAQWAHSLGFVGTDCALSDFDPCLRVCPQRMACEAARVCLHAWTRQARVLRARFYVAQARAASAHRA